MYEFSKHAGAVGTNRPSPSQATELQKVATLNEFVAAAGCARKYDTRMLNHPGTPHVELTRPRARRYGSKIQERCTWPGCQPIALVQGV